MSTTKKIVALLLALLMVGMLFAGCAKQETSEKPIEETSSDGRVWPVETDNPKVTVLKSEPPKGFPVTATPDTLTIAQGGEPATLYPLEGNEIPNMIACRPLYETLLWYNEFTEEFEGRIAESWEFVDDCTVRLHIRPGVLCHAGYEMTAEDVLWTAQMGASMPRSSFVWASFDIDNCKVVDKYTIDMVTPEPFGPVLDYLSNPSVGYIINKQAFEEQTPEDYARNPTGGTGPYKFVEWIAGDRIIYERFEEYWGEKPYFKNLVDRNIADDVTRALALEAGEIDLCYNVEAASYQALIDSPNANIVEFPSYWNVHMGLNNAIAPFDNKLVRQAIRTALDLENIVNLAYAGTAEVADAPWPNSLKTYEPATGDVAYEYNPEKAKELLKEAGYENGFEFDLWCAETTAWVQMAEMIQNGLAEVGITANVKIMDQSTLIEERAKGEYQAYIARFSCSSGDTDWWFNRLYSELPYQQNVCQYHNDRVDELMLKCRYSVDEEQRYKDYMEVLQLWREDCGWIPLACPKMCYGIRSTLCGIEPHAYGIGDQRFIHPIDMEG